LGRGVSETYAGEKGGLKMELGKEKDGEHLSVLRLRGFRETGLTGSWGMDGMGFEGIREVGFLGQDFQEGWISGFFGSGALRWGQGRR
jgi:hypothetical protein